MKQEGIVKSIYLFFVGPFIAVIINRRPPGHANQLPLIPNTFDVLSDLRQMLIYRKFKWLTLERTDRSGVWTVSTFRWISSYHLLTKAHNNQHPPNLWHTNYTTKTSDINSRRTRPATVQWDHDVPLYLSDYVTIEHDMYEFKVHICSLLCSYQQKRLIWSCLSEFRFPRLCN